MPPSRNRIDHLGRQLAADALTLDEFEELQEVRRTCNELISELKARVAPISAPDHPTGRLKNLGTIADKIRRDNTSLARMRDVVGCRVISSGGRPGQLELIDRLVDALQDWSPKVIDRCADPRHGYRAVHLELKIGAQPAELQVRTEMQHVWAEAMERVADVVGREIRYGVEPDVSALSAGQQRTAEVVRVGLAALSKLIADLEEVEVRLDELTRRRDFARSQVPDAGLGWWERERVDWNLRRINGTMRKLQASMDKQRTVITECAGAVEHAARGLRRKVR